MQSPTPDNTTAMPTPPRNYSSSAADKLRLALLALAATATTGCGLTGDSYHGYTGGVPPLDLDGDGIADYDEPFYGTDPHNWDSDGDGFSDGDEVRIHKTDPCDPKSVPLAHNQKDSQ